MLQISYKLLNKTCYILLLDKYSFRTACEVMFEFRIPQNLGILSTQRECTRF